MEKLYRKYAVKQYPMILVVNLYILLVYCCTMYYFAVNCCLMILVVNLCFMILVVNLHIVLVHCCTMLCTGGLYMLGLS